MPKGFALARCLSLALAVGAALASGLLAPSGLAESVWQPLCEAARLRPPEHLWPGLWRFLAYGSVKAVGLSATCVLLRFLGPVVFGFIAYRVSMGIYKMLIALLGTDRCRPDFHNALVPLLSASGAALFVATDDVFHASWSCSPDLLQLMLLLLVFDQMRRFFFRSEILSGASGIFLTGVLVADGTVGLVVLAAIVVTHFIRRQREADCPYILSNPGLYHVWKWITTGLFLLGFLLVGGAGLWFFLHGDGSWGSAFAGYWQGIGSSDVALSVSLVAVPFVLAVAVLPQATDNMSFLSYSVGILLILSGIASYVYLVLPELTRLPCFSMRAVLLYAAAFTLVSVFATILVEVCCRNHQSVLIEQYGVDPGDMDVIHRRHYRFPAWLRIGMPYALTGFLLLSAICLRGYDRSACLAEEIDACADAMLAETEGVTRLFSDGSLDELLEIKASACGRRILACSLFDGEGDHAVSVRQRGLVGEDERYTMALGASVSLGMWIEQASPLLADSAVQVGLEMWRRGNRPMPPLGGFAAHPAGCPEDRLASFRAAADAFAERALSDRLREAYERCRDHRLRERFDRLKFRVCRLMALRAAEADRKGSFETATALFARVKALDGSNASLEHMRSFLGLLWDQSELRLTPREGLALSLRRANFRAAKPHAEAVLTSTPDDPDAHFALGMYYYLSRAFELADSHLTQALAVRPNEAAILNNLAIVRMYRNRLPEALKLSDRALELHPERDDLKATNEEIRRRLQR